MNYYKDTAGNVYAYNDIQTPKDGLIEMTPEEVEAHLNPAPTPEQRQQQTNAQARAYLTSTDWYVIRQQENGTPIPQEILDARQAARDSVVEDTNA